MQRDSKKRKFEDMSAAQQHTLEDFDTGRAEKRHARECGKRLTFFTGKIY